MFVNSAQEVGGKRFPTKFLTTYTTFTERPVEQVRHDLARGYISAETARRNYGLSDADTETVEAAVRAGEAL